MILVRTDHENFEAYIRSLSKSARQNWQYVKKHNTDLTYERAEFNPGECETFMRLWEKQLVRGKPIQWAFPIGHVENIAREGRLLYFRATLGGKPIAAHFVELHDGIIECHPPMYEKTNENNKRYLAKYMWFSLINYCITNRLPHLDFGGGPDDWRTHIARRDEYPNPTYKWIYVSEKAKKDPQSEPNYKLVISNGKRIYTY